MLITLLGFASAQLAHAGAWVPAKGSGYSKLGLTTYSADEVFGDDSVDGSFDGRNISYYGEAGLGGKFAVYGTILYQDIEQTSLGQKTSSAGLGDAELGLRYQWQAQPFVLSSSLLVKLPYFYDENAALPRGNGQEDLEAKILIGKSLNSFGYFGIEAGYRFRSDAPSDEYRYLLEYGVSANANLYFRTKLDGIKSVGNAEQVNAGGVNLSATPEFDLGKLELTVGWQFDKASGNANNGRYGVEFTYTDDLYGDNTLNGEALQLGLTYAY